MKVDLNNIIKAVRNYLNFCEQCDKLPVETIAKYRVLLKIKKSRIDYRVPTDEEVVKGYELVKDKEALEILYLILATSGIRYIEAIEFLKNLDFNRFNIYTRYVSYNVSSLRHTKNIHNIYLPIFVYKKLKFLDINSNSTKQYLKNKGCSFSWKYLRKWHYLEKVEKEMNSQIFTNACVQTGSCCNPCTGLAASNANTQIKKQVEELKQCPKCKSGNVKKEAKYFKKQE